MPDLDLDPLEYRRVDEPAEVRRTRLVGGLSAILVIGAVCSWSMIGPAWVVASVIPLSFVAGVSYARLAGRTPVFNRGGLLSLAIFVLFAFGVPIAIGYFSGSYGPH